MPHPQPAPALAVARSRISFVRSTMRLIASFQLALQSAAAFGERHGQAIATVVCLPAVQAFSSKTPAVHGVLFAPTHADDAAVLHGNVEGASI